MARAVLVCPHDEAPRDAVIELLRPLGHSSHRDQTQRNRNRPSAQMLDATRALTATSARDGPCPPSAVTIDVSAQFNEPARAMMTVRPSASTTQNGPTMLVDLLVRSSVRPEARSSELVGEGLPGSNRL